MLILPHSSQSNNSPKSGNSPPRPQPRNLRKHFGDLGNAFGDHSAHPKQSKSCQSMPATRNSRNVPISIALDKVKRSDSPTKQPTSASRRLHEAIAASATYMEDGVGNQDRHSCAPQIQKAKVKRVPSYLRPTKASAAPPADHSKPGLLPPSPGPLKREKAQQASKQGISSFQRSHSVGTQGVKPASQRVKSEVEMKRESRNRLLGASARAKEQHDRRRPQSAIQMPTGSRPSTASSRRALTGRGHYQASGPSNQNVASTSLAVRDPMDFLEQGSKLGAGAFGEVKLCRHSITGQMVAVKTYEKYKIKQFERYRVGTFDDAKPVCAEIDTLCKLDHPNVVHLYQAVYSSKRIHLLLEFCPGHTLEQELCKNGGPLSESHAKPLIRQLVAALSHCHNNNVCHRDVKLDNIMIVHDETGKKTVKLIDFGVGQVLKSGKQRLSLQCGTPAYAAPEIVSDSRYAGSAVDIWSLGVVLYIILVGDFPFQPKPSLNHMVQRITKGQFEAPPKSLSSDARELIYGLLQPDPKKRWSMNTIKQCAWLNPSDTQDDEVAVFDSENKWGTEVDTGALEATACSGFDREEALQSIKERKRTNSSTCYRLFLVNKEQNLRRRAADVQ